MLAVREGEEEGGGRAGEEVEEGEEEGGGEEGGINRSLGLTDTHYCI